MRKKLGVLICEEFWFGDEILGRPRYTDNPVTDVVEQGAEILIDISASPFNVGKRSTRYDMFRGSLRPTRCRSSTATRSGKRRVALNGSSIVINADGRTVFCASSFAEDRTMVKLNGPLCGLSTRCLPSRKRRKH